MIFGDSPSNIMMLFGMNSWEFELGSFLDDSWDDSDDRRRKWVKPWESRKTQQSMDSMDTWGVDRGHRGHHWRFRAVEISGTPRFAISCGFLVLV